MSKGRFSKDKLLEDLQKRAERMRKSYDFDPNNGWAQVHGKGDAKNRAYGEWEALMTTIRQIREGDIGR